MDPDEVAHYELLHFDQCSLQVRTVEFSFLMLSELLFSETMIHIAYLFCLSEPSKHQTKIAADDTLFLCSRDNSQGALRFFCFCLS